MGHKSPQNNALANKYLFFIVSRITIGVNIYDSQNYKMYFNLIITFQKHSLSIHKQTAWVIASRQGFL